MSSLAQEESRSISENVTWGHRKRFSDGKVMVPFGRFLGYERGENGNLVINEEQAKTVRYIYKLFIDGYSAYSIAKKLTDEGIKSPGGKDTWSGSTVKSILSNEKYKGCALLQKVYTVNYLTKKKKKNEGEVPRYFVEDSHPYIIEPELYDLVQSEMARRQESSRSNNYSGIGPFAARIRCSECGAWFGSKVWRSNDKYRRVIYRCNHKYEGGRKCRTPHVTEDELKHGFMEAFNSLLTEKDELLADIETVRKTLKSSKALEKEKEDAEQEMAVVAELMDQRVDENARVAQDQADYRKRYAALEERYETAKARHGEVLGKLAKAEARETMLGYFAKTIKKQKPVESFNEQLWNTTVEYVTVGKDKKLTYRFKNGTEITV